MTFSVCELKKALEGGGHVPNLSLKERGLAFPASGPVLSMDSLGTVKLPAELGMWGGGLWGRAEEGGIMCLRVPLLLGALGTF